MKSSVLGKLRNTPLPTSKPLAPLYEAIANSIHAIEDTPPGNHYIDITIRRLSDLVESDVGRPVSFIVKDSGVGFDDQNTESFFTSDSTHKAERGARGNGRFIWLKTFDEVKIESHYFDRDGKLRKRAFSFERRDDQEPPKPQEPTAESVGTRLELLAFEEKLSKQLSRSNDWIANRVVGHFLPYFRRPDCPKVLLRDEGEQPINLNDLFAATVDPATPRNFTVLGDTYTLTGYKVRSVEAPENIVVFAADKRAVKTEKLSTHIRGLERKLDLEAGGVGAVYVGFVEGDKLDAMVKWDRLGFESSEDEDTGELFDGGFSLSAIRAAALDEVRTALSSELKFIQESKEAVVHEYVTQKAPEYRRIFESDRARILDALSSHPRPKEIENAVGRIWMERRAELKDQGIKLLNHPPDAESMEAYQVQMNWFIDKFEELDQTALAQHVTHRRVIINLLDQALKRRDDTGKYQLEALIHRMIHPMRKTSDEIEFDEQNLWLIDDRLTYHDHLASDVELRSNPRLESDSQMRPDLLAIYDRTLAFGEGRDPYVAFSVIEFKRPMRLDFPDRTPLAQVFDVVREIREGKFKARGGRPIDGMSKDAPAYCFVICDVTPAVERGAEDAGGQLTPDGRGYFGWNANLKLYFEVISYEKLVADALRRNRYLFKKLGLPTERDD
jgi:hypothetical protein